MRKLSGVHLDRVNKREAKFAKIESAKPPEYLDAVAATEFNRLLPELTANGLLNRANLSVFASYCAQHSMMVHALEDVRARGFSIGTEVFDKNGRKTGEIVLEINPSVKVARDSALAAKNIAIEFGLTPAAATKVAASLGEEKRPREESFADFITKPTDNKSAKRKDGDPVVQ